MIPGRVLILFLIFHLTFWPVTASARIFNPNDIITDRELMDKDSLSRTAVQIFLDSKRSVLSEFIQLVAGSLKKASEIIWLVSQQYGVSPKFLLAKLQKEQGLIEKETASEKALDWATGYSCFNGGCSEKYKGFFAQLDATASTQLIYNQNPARFKFKVGSASKTHDGYEVAPENQATANLYIYTPYRGGENGIGGNYFFSRIWDRYFTSRKFPDGLVLRDEAGQYYLIDKGKKRPFESEAVYLERYGQSDYFISTTSDLSYYPPGPLVTHSSLVSEERFASPAGEIKDGTIFKDSSGTVFLSSAGEMHRLNNITTASRVFGYDRINGAPVFSDDKISLLKAGDPIEYIDDTIKDTGEEIKLWLAVYDKALLTSSWRVGETQKGVVGFRNVGALNWRPGEVWLIIKSTSKKIPITSEIVSGQTVSFNINFEKSDEPKLVDEFYILENKEGPIPGGLIIKTYSVDSDEQAQIVSENFPESVSNLRRPVKAEVKVKNTGRIAWNPRRTAFQIVNANGKKSAFYDGSDWLNNVVAATPMERRLIKPGMTATFAFTFDARGIEPGSYPQNISIKLTDKGKVLWLDYKKPYALDISIVGKSYKKARRR